jgi:hypothetical protein
MRLALSVVFACGVSVAFIYLILELLRCLTDEDESQPPPPSSPK